MLVLGISETGLLRAIAPRYRYCSGTFTVAVTLAQLLLIEKSGDGSAVTFHWFLGATRYVTFELRNSVFLTSIIVLEHKVGVDC